MILRKEVNRQWWYKFLRGVNYFTYRNWAWILLIFLLSLVLWYSFCYLELCNRKSKCCIVEDYKQKVLEINDKLDNCCQCSLNIEDEIRKRRTNYNGKTGNLTVSLIWESVDDLDLSLKEPNGQIISFKNRISNSGGQLDVDMNANFVTVNDPLENIYYSSNVPKGRYQICVQYFTKNSSLAYVPYKVELNIAGESKIFNNIHSNVKDKHVIHEFIIQ